MKQEFTLAEFTAQLAVLNDFFPSVTVADPLTGQALDPATLRPTGETAVVPMLDDAGCGMQMQQEDGGELLLSRAVQVDCRPCVLVLHSPLPNNSRATVGAQNSQVRATAQYQDDMRRDYCTGAYNAHYINEIYRRYAEQEAMAGKPMGVVMARVNEYWSLREKESLAAAGCCLNAAAGILELVVGPDPEAAVLARLEDGLFLIVTVGTPAAEVAKTLNEALDSSRKQFALSLSRRGSFTVSVASAEWGETSSWEMMLSLTQQRL